MKKLISIAVILSGCINMYGQDDSLVNAGSQGSPVIKDSSAVLAAGMQYKASGWKMLWWGKHYRKEWTTPVTFPVLQLSTFEGGLKPLKAGGGHESKSLRLLAANGKEYVLRTVDKSLDVLVVHHQ